MMFCTNCGMELPEGNNFCSRCGQNLSGSSSSSSPTSIKRERHGFVTFYLWLTIIGGSISLISLFANDRYWLPLFDYNRTLLTIGGICQIFFIIAPILILNWINGFWLWLGVAIATPFIFSHLGFVPMFFGSAIGCLIQFGILHLKKNGISTWAYLTNKNHSDKETQNYTDRKCEICQTIYNGTSCPKCGSSFFENV